MAERKPAGDEHLGNYVYCTQHCRVHDTGWCGVDPKLKIPLPQATNAEEAQHDWGLLRRYLEVSLG